MRWLIALTICFAVSTATYADAVRIEAADPAWQGVTAAYLNANQGEAILINRQDLNRFTLLIEQEELSRDEQITKTWWTAVALTIAGIVVGSITTVAITR